MANRYWRGGAGTWDTITTTNWSTTSGGLGGASAPTAADDAILDANSGTGAITVVTGALCKSLNTTGSSSSLTMGGGTLTCSGSVTNPASTTVITGVTFTINGTGTLSIASTIQQLTVSGVGITATLGANLSTSSSVVVSSGTFNASTFNVTTKIFTSTGSTARTISMGSGTWTLTGEQNSGTDEKNSTVVNFTGSNLTVNGNTSTISLTNAGQFETITFNGLSKTFYNLSIDGAANPLNFIITGANTFNQISETMSVPYIVTFPSSSTTTVTTLALSGAFNNLATLRSSTLGTTATLAVTNTFTSSYIAVNSITLSAANIGTVTSGYIQESTNWKLGSGSNYYQAVTTTGVNTVTLPASWTNSNEIHLFGAGGGASGGISNGTDAVSGGAGGGGGGYSKLTNIASSASSTVYCDVGVGGTGGTGSTASVASTGTSGGSTTFGTSLATITFIAEGEASGSGGSVTITKPTGTANGDLMIAFLSATGAGSNNFSTLSGWTLATDQLQSGVRLNIQYRYASSEGANYTFSGANNTTTYGVILTYRNVYFDAVGTVATLVLSPTSPAITVSQNNALVFNFINGTNNTQTYTTPTGFTLIDSQTANPPFAISSKSFNSGSTGTVANTASAGTNQSVLLSIIPTLSATATAGGGAGGSSTTTTSVAGTGGTASGGSVNYTGGAGGTGSVGTGGGASSARGGGGGGGCAGLNGNGGAGGNGSGTITDNKNGLGGGGGGASGGSAGGNAVANTSSGSGGNNFLNFGGYSGYTSASPSNTPLGNGTYGAGGRGTWDTNQASGSISCDLVANIFSAGGGSGDRGIRNTAGTAVYGGGGGGGGSQRTTIRDGSAGGNGLVVLIWGSAASTGNFFFLLM